jgi:hypothetical protein
MSDNPLTLKQVEQIKRLLDESTMPMPTLKELLALCTAYRHAVELLANLKDEYESILRSEWGHDGNPEPYKGRVNWEQTRDFLKIVTRR